MVARRKDEKVVKLRRPPSPTPEGRENQLISLAVDLAEKQLAEGIASSQVISHYLKLGSSREKLEQERISKENELLEVKKAAMESAQRVEALYEEAMNAFRSYAGYADDTEGFDD
jgi:hypothetical protein